MSLIQLWCMLTQTTSKEFQAESATSASLSVSLQTALTTLCWTLNNRNLSNLVKQCATVASLLEYCMCMRWCASRQPAMWTLFAQQALMSGLSSVAAPFSLAVSQWSLWKARHKSISEGEDIKVFKLTSSWYNSPVQLSHMLQHTWKTFFL